MGTIAMDSLTGGALAGPLSPVGLGIGGLVVAATLVVAVVYLDAVDARPDRAETRRRVALAVVTPLLLTFGAVVLYQAAATLGW
jgi:hypothetical protein